MQTGNRLELLDSFKLPFERPLMLEPVPINHLDSAMVAQDVARQPDFAIASDADAANHFVIGNRGRLKVGR